MRPDHLMFAAAEPDLDAIAEAVRAAVEHAVVHDNFRPGGWVESHVLTTADVVDLRMRMPDLDLWRELPLGWVVIVVGFFAPPPGASRPDLN